MARKNAPQPVYAVVGKDRFLRAEVVAGISAGIGQDASDLGPVRVDGESAALADVLDEVRTPSLLGGIRVVIVEEADAFISAHRAAIEGYCESPSATGCLVLLCDSLPRNTRLYKSLEKTGRVITCEPPKGKSLALWIVDRASQAYAKRIAPQAAALLREHIGDECGAIDAELAKLATFVGSRTEITAADVQALTGCIRVENVFAVTSAMAAGDATAALRQWEQVVATDRAAPARAVAGIAWAVRRLLEARRELARGASMHALAGRMFTDAPALEKTFRRWTERDLERQMTELLEIDIASKTGLTTVESAVERFIIRHAGSARLDRPAGVAARPGLRG